MYDNSYGNDNILNMHRKQRERENEQSNEKTDAQVNDNSSTKDAKESESDIPGEKITGDNEAINVGEDVNTLAGGNEGDGKILSYDTTKEDLSDPDIIKQIAKLKESQLYDYSQNCKDPDVRIHMMQQLITRYPDIPLIAELVHIELTTVEAVINSPKIFVNLQKLKLDQLKIDEVGAIYLYKYGITLDTDLKSKLKGTECQLALELLKIKADVGQIDLLGNTPATADDYSNAAARIHKALTNDPVLIEDVFAALIPMNREKVKLDTLKASYTKAFPGHKLNDDINTYIKDKQQNSYAAFLAFEYTSPSVTPSPITTGTEQLNDDITGGKVKAHTGAAYRNNNANKPIPEMFTVGYNGGLANDANWLQFVWREAIAYVNVPSPNGPVEVAVRRPFHFLANGGGAYDATIDPADKHYGIDGKPGVSPFYSGGVIRDKTNGPKEAITMYDAPNAGINGTQAFMNEVFITNKAHKLESIVHLHAYLIRDYYPVYEVTNTITWTFTSATDPGTRVFTPSTGADVTELDAGMKAQLDKDYSNFSYIR
jgi:hypothetical protein